METPNPPAKRLWKEKATVEILRVLRDSRVGSISTRRNPPEEECDGEGSDGGEGEEGGPSPPKVYLLRHGVAVLSLCYFLCLLSPFP